MTRSMAWVFVLAGLLVLGCVTKGSFDDKVAELEECRQDKKAAQDASAACQERFERETARWDEMGAAVTEALPRTIDEFREEKDKILDLIPEQVREEVAAYVDDFSTAVGQGFQQLHSDNQKLLRDNERILIELENAQLKLEDLGVRTEAIDQTVGVSLKTAHAAQAAMKDRAAEVIARIQEFDRAYVNDRKSKTRLYLNRKERETITNFHADVVRALNELANAQVAVEKEEPGARP